jgi:hypothetical protein
VYKQKRSKSSRLIEKQTVLKKGEISMERSGSDGCGSLQPDLGAHVTSSHGHRMAAQGYEVSKACTFFMAVDELIRRDGASEEIVSK